MDQVYVYTVKTDDGYLDNNYQFSNDIFAACLFRDASLAQTSIDYSKETMSNPRVVKVLKSTMLTPVL